MTTPPTPPTTTDTGGASAPREREPAYFCMHCPETFATAAESNQHHIDTGHHQHWVRERGYEARQARAAADGTKLEPVHGHPDTFVALQAAVREQMRAVASSCRPHGPDGARSHTVEPTPALLAAMTAVRAELRGLPAMTAADMAERLHNLSSRAAVALGLAPSAAAWADLPPLHRKVVATACELLLQGER